jgi:hypothetical protein
MLDFSPFEIAHRRLGVIGVRLERLPGEYRVRLARDPETAFEAFESLPEAVARGEQLGAERPPVASPARRGRRVFASVKARMRAMRKAHNRRRWATLGIIARNNITPPG